MAKKKRSAAAAFDRNSGVAGHSKISAVILDFARPVNAVLAGRNPDLETVRGAMAVVIKVWNAHVLAMPMWGRPEVLAQLQATMASPAAPPALKLMVAALSDERQSRFADMPLLVGKWSMVEQPGGLFSLTCDGHLPGHLIL